MMMERKFVNHAMYSAINVKIQQIIAYFVKMQSKTIDKMFCLHAIGIFIFLNFFNFFPKFILAYRDIIAS
jgi:hypothetical protein